MHHYLRMPDGLALVRQRRLGGIMRGTETRRPFTRDEQIAYIRSLLDASSDGPPNIECPPRNEVDLARRVVWHLHRDGGFSAEQIADLIGDCFYHRDRTSAAS